MEDTSPNRNSCPKALPIRDLLPHDHPMILLDRVDSCREHGLTACVYIGADSLFVQPQGVPSWVGLEYMGQAIAAHAGVCARRDGHPVRIGFLVSTRRYDPACSYFPIGATLHIAVDAVTYNSTGLQVFECTISGPDVIVTANLNVFMPENVEKFMLENL
ncbi:hypothetical protein Q6D67_05380 [Haliea sp. E1-2-M8]|uniref:ApeP family dehydratase n=1 Tax=Haliea sp. E1-2-M8 TaxID=3064706 RepID=UPI0027276385|nr:hypothetical protein [Haliea sp. E1-2-M8]MDO8861129.1 hypothetical protein [Haliea sp. E1-2-M8]